MSQIKRVMVSLPGCLLDEVDLVLESEDLQFKNRSEFFKEAIQSYLSERKRCLLREQMRIGYIEMAKLNLFLAMENSDLDSECFVTFESFLEAK